ncbi:MAG: peroxiredoxin family protein [bacterium]
MQAVLQLRPELEEIGEQGIDFYFIIAGQERELRAFFERYPVPADVLWDEDLQIFWDYDIEALPTTFFIDREGLVFEVKLSWGKDSLVELKSLANYLVSE